MLCWKRYWSDVLCIYVTSLNYWFVVCYEFECFIDGKTYPMDAKRWSYLKKLLTSIYYEWSKDEVVLKFHIDSLYDDKILNTLLSVYLVSFKTV